MSDESRLADNSQVLGTPKQILVLPDLEQSKTAVLNSLTSKSCQRTYECAINDFVEWHCSALAFNRSVVLRYRIFLEQKQYAPTTINLWSGERSNRAALGLKSLLEAVFQRAFQVFISEYISPGENWVQRIQEELKQSQIGLSV